MKIISILGQKGGISKTTTAVNLAAGLALNKKNVLLVDFDAQANATKSVGSNSSKGSISELLDGKSIDITKTSFNFDLIPSDLELASTDVWLATQERNKWGRLARALPKSGYDYIIIDCPPALGMLSMNAAVASSDYIMPIAPSFFAIDGVKNMSKTLASIGHKINFMGMLLTKYGGKTRIEKKIKRELPDGSFKTKIRQCVEVEYSQQAGIPLVVYKPRSKAAIDYMDFTKEVLKRG